MKQRVGLVTFISLTIAGIFFTDQISKYMVLNHIIRPAIFGDGLASPSFWEWLCATHIRPLPFTSIPVTPFFNIVMVWNKGISFGVLAGDHSNTLLLAALSLVTAAFVIWMVRARQTFLKTILAVIIGGACGNLWDRVRFGGVADFLDFHAFGFHYPAFNVADSAIVLGVFTLALYELTKGGLFSPALERKMYHDMHAALGCFTGLCFACGLFRF